MTDPMSFHLRFNIDKKSFVHIDDDMAVFDESTAKDLEKPIRKNTICAAKFSDDNQWYRARIEKTLGKGKLDVYFIDFGNKDQLEASELKQLPQTLLEYNPVARHCTLAYIKTPKYEDPLGEEIAAKFRDLVWEKDLEVEVVDKVGQLHYVVVREKDTSDNMKSINAQLVKKAMARLDTSFDLPEDMAELQKIANEHREDQKGVYEYGSDDES
jgi:staphylococcal nuclease domain-containing protein 1